MMTSNRLKSKLEFLPQRIDFDLSKKALYEFVVQVTDTSSRQANTLVKVTVKDVNDNAPSVSPPSTSLALTANDAAGKSVAQFRARDIDSGVNGQFRLLGVPSIHNLWCRLMSLGVA